MVYLQTRLINMCLIKTYGRLHTDKYLSGMFLIRPSSDRAVCGRSLAGIAGLNLTRVMDICLVSVVCFLCDRPITFPGSPIDCCVSLNVIKRDRTHLHVAWGD